MTIVRDRTLRGDAIDRQLVESLLRDVHASNREMGAAVGLSERGVAARLDRLRADNVFAATVVVDWRLVGFETSCLLFLRTGPFQRSTDWIQKVTGRPDVQSLTHTVGGAPAVVHLLGRDLATLERSAAEISALASADVHEILLITDYCRYSIDRTPLPLEPWNPDALEPTARALDALDRKIMRCLIEDGHQSYRQIGHQLQVSEATVRTRWKQLEQSGLVRLTTVYDPFAFGEAVMTYFLVRSAAGRQSACRQWLEARSEVVGLMTCLGRYDLVGVAVADSHDALVQLVAELQGQGVTIEIQYLPIVDTPFYHLHLARLV